MKTGQWRAFPLVVSLLFLGCASEPLSDSTHSNPHFPELSGVSKHTLREYPPSRFLYGIGEADSKEAAIELARADLAKKIQVRVTAAATDLERAQGEKSDRLYGRLVTTRANEMMNGIHIAEIGRDQESGLTRAVVTLSKTNTEWLNTSDERTNTPNSSIVSPLPSTEPVWVTAEGQVPFGPDTTLGEAAARSRDQARRQAVERAIGTFVKGETLVYNTTVTANTVHSVVRGIIIEEEIVEEGVRTVDQQAGAAALFYVTKLRAKVKPVPPPPRNGLKLEVELNRTVYQEGDEVQVAIISSHDAYVYILNVGQDDHVTMVFPNRFAHDNFLEAEQEFLFPDEIQRNMGIQLRTALPPGERKSIEKVKVLATSKRLRHSDDQHHPSSFFEPTDYDRLLVTDLMKRLALLEDTEWFETTIPYEIRR